jgi:precorrin-6Y C5,15-methyltransferase (decarboxylating)
MTRWLSIIGIGAEGLPGLSAAACALLEGAAHVFGPARHVALACGAISGESHVWHPPILDAIPGVLACRGVPCVVLASGDPFWFGIGTRIAAVVPPNEFACIPAPSCFALACARLGWAMQHVGTLSFCGRPLERLRPHLQPGARLLLLSADATTPGAVAAYLADRGFGRSRLHILERLGAPDESVRAFDDTRGVAPLNMLALEVVAGPGARVLPLASGLPDDLFEHDGQITKREIRAVTLSALAPRQGEMLWDIGAGSGSVGIEWMLRHPANRAAAFEPRAERAARIARNALALGVPELAVVPQAAPDALVGRHAPDAVFVGGGASDPGVLDAVWAALRPGGRMVANAVTLETELALGAAWSARGGEMTRIGVERLDRLGGMHGFRPGMTVTQWLAVKP